MPEMKPAVHVRITHPNDFLIVPTRQEMQIVIRSGDQWVTILMPRDISLMMATEQIKAEAKQLQREVGRKVQSIVVFEEAS